MRNTHNLRASGLRLVPPPAARRLAVRLTALLVLAALTLLAPAGAQAGGFKKLLTLSKSQETEIAEQMHGDIAKDPGLIEKGKLYDLVQSTGKKLVDKNALTGYEYKFFVVQQDEVNAFATPGGYIYVTKGLLDYMAYDESMLAAVMAHELGHAKDRHVVKGYEKMLQGALGVGVLGLLLGKKNQDITQAVAQLGGVVYLKYNRDQEEWADRAGVDLNYKAGYDAYGLTRSLQLLEALYGSSDEVGTWLSNHPATKDRVERTYYIAFNASGEQLGYRQIPCPPDKEHPLYALYGGNCGKKTKPIPPPGQAAEKHDKGDPGTAERYDRRGKQTSPAR